MAAGVMAARGVQDAARTPERTRRARRLVNGTLIAGVALLLVLVALVAAAPWLTPYDPYEQDLLNALQPPSRAHWLGTDQLGRDTLTRVLYGGRIDLRIGVIAVIAPCLLGVLLGTLAGFYGGWCDGLIMRVVDVILAFPGIVLIIAVLAVLGPGLQNMFIVVAITGWVGYARLMRASILGERQREYVEAARAIGAADGRVLAVHVLPNVITALIIVVVADIPLYILLAAGLSYLGLGANPPTPEWGAMIVEGQPYLTSAWWLSTLPGIAIVVTGVAWSLIGDGLADALRPGTR